jgi:hypothetical protein
MQPLQLHLCRSGTIISLQRCLYVMLCEDSIHGVLHHGGTAAAVMAYHRFGQQQCILLFPAIAMQCISALLLFLLLLLLFVCSAYAIDFRVLHRESSVCRDCADVIELSAECSTGERVKRTKRGCSLQQLESPDPQQMASLDAQNVVPAARRIHAVEELCKPSDWPLEQPNDELPGTAQPWRAPAAASIGMPEKRSMLAIKPVHLPLSLPSPPCAQSDKPFKGKTPVR